MGIETRYRIEGHLDRGSMARISLDFGIARIDVQIQWSLRR